MRHLHFFLPLLLCAIIPKAHAEFFLIENSDGHGFHPIVASNSIEAGEILEEMTKYGTISYFKAGRTKHQCKPGGWWALARDFKGMWGGACNHSTREAAKLAAIHSCRNKGECRMFEGELASGFDAPNFDAKEHAEAMIAVLSNGSTYGGMPLVSPRKEICEGFVGKWECFHFEPGKRGSKTEMNIDRIERSPWD